MRIKLNLAISLLILLTIQCCKKSEYKSECCTHETKVYPNLAADTLEIWAPNAFTPNRDGLNDYFQIEFNNVDPQDFYIKIYQDNKSFLESKELNFAWNGVQNGKVYEGVYSYYILGSTLYGNDFEAKGEFCLLLKSNSKNTPIKNCESCTFSDMIDAREGFIYQTHELLEDCE